VTRLIIVLGGTGFVGQAVTTHLRNVLGDVSVISIDRTGSDFDVNLESDFKIDAVLESLSLNGSVEHLSMINCAGQTVFTDNELRSMDEILTVAQSQLGISIVALNQLVHLCRRKKIPGTAILMSSIFATNAPRFEIYRSLNRQSSEIYGATKAGVERLAKYYAQKYGREQIRVNCISPGGIFDPNVHSQEFRAEYATATALGRMTELDEVVRAISFLESDDSSGITGAVIPVDCGYGL